MISKVFTGHSFYGAVQYVCKDQRRAQVLASEGVREHDYRLMIKDFVLQQQLRPSKKQACFHSILSFYPGEKISDQKMAETGKKYLEAIGITNTQYAITKHIDKAHIHLHIIANMVNNDGRSISDQWIGLKGKKAAQQLTEKFQLIPALEKNLKLTHLEALNESEANRYKIYTAITASLLHCSSMDALQRHLLQQGITTLYKYKGQTGELQGVSFKTGNDCFKGSAVDRRYSLGNLQKLMAQQQKQQAGSNSSGKMQKVSVAYEQKDQSFDPENAAKTIDILINPVSSCTYTPAGLMQKSKRKRKRKISQNR